MNTGSCGGLRQKVDGCWAGRAHLVDFIFKHIIGRDLLR